MDSTEIIKKSVSTGDEQSFVKFGLLQKHSAGLIFFNLTKLLRPLAKSKSTIERWASRLKKGEPLTSNNFGGDRSDAKIHEERVEIIKSCFDESRHWSMRSLASRTGIPLSSVQRIVTNELKMTKKLGKWVPYKLTSDQENYRELCARVNLRTYNKTKTLLNRTLSIDETWLSLYMEPDRNQQRQYMYQGEQPEPTVR